MGSWENSKRKPDVYVSSLSKALGSFGGYVASSARVVDLCTNTARTMIYTSALPSHIASHAMMRILYPLRLARQKTLEKNTIHLHKYLQKAGYDTNNSISHNTYTYWR